MPDHTPDPLAILRRTLAASFPTMRESAVKSWSLVVLAEVEPTR